MKNLKTLTLFSLTTLLVASVSFAHTNKKSGSHKHDHHREHQAHQHGAGKLGLAFEGTKGVIDFEIPAESIMGFEHEAKSKADQKKKADSIELLKTKMNEMVQFDSTLNCVMQAQDVQVVSQEKNHSEVKAQYAVQCEKSLLGSVINFNLQKHFKRIKKVDVQIIVDSLQKSIEVKNKPAQIKLD